MKKMILLCLILVLLLTSNVFAQVVADFEDSSLGTMGFVDGDWGTAISSIAQTTDPSGASNGVLEVNFDASGDKDPVMINNYTLEKIPALISYDLWLPADCPDSIFFKVFTQDVAWNWQDMGYYAKDLPKEVWFPVYYDFRIGTMNGSDFTQTINRIGIEFQAYAVVDSNKTWSGKLYMDNVKLIGAEPEVLADFEDPELGTYGFVDGDWGTGITSIGQVDGSLQINFDATTASNDPVMLSDVTGLEEVDVISYEIYLPADCPDSLLLKLFSQDDPNWKWQDELVYGIDIPKETWYPINYSIAQKTALGGNFSTKANRLGIEFDARSMPADQQTFTGTILLDNVKYMNSETGTKWVLADWEPSAAATYLEAGGWGSEGNGIMTLERREDPTDKSEGVLFSSWAFSASADAPKDALTQSPVDLGWSDTEDGATSITIDIYAPEDFPAGINLEMWMQSHSWGWFSWSYPVSDTSTVKPGQWSTMTIDLVANAEALELRTASPQKYGVQLTSTVDWTGDILFDNLTVHGIEQPDAELHTPTLLSTFIDSSFVTGEKVQSVLLEWDNSDQPGFETYDIYMSEDPITDLTADGIIKIATDIPHGAPLWSHRPWTPTGEKKSFYYAIIAKMGEDITELKTEGTVGPIEFTKTSIPAIAVYDQNFASKFTLDGLDTEFTEEYKKHLMVPEYAGNAEADNWSLESEDLMFRNTFVVDDEFLYISADVTDDNVLTEQGVSQAWMGDALEFYIGAYDIKEVSEWHTKGSVGAAGTGDHRFAFTAWGTIELNGHEPVESYAGIEFIIYQKWGGDGYIIEAKVNLDSLSADGNFEVVEGMMLPLKIDNNDRDPENGDSERTLSCNWGSVGVAEIGNSESWLRPSSWGYLMLGNAPVATDDNDEQVLNKFELHNNYPNPFNPTTSIKFQIPAHANVQLAIYDMLGNRIKTIVNEKRAAGIYDAKWDGTNDMGVNVSSGIYFYRLTTNNHVATKKMMFIK